MAYLRPFLIVMTLLAVSFVPAAHIVQAESPSVVLVVSTPETVTAGAPFSVTVTALNLDNSTATTFTGNVSFTSSDPNATPPQPYSFTPADGGVHTFSAIFRTAGVNDIRARTNGQVQNSGFSPVFQVQPSAAAAATLITVHGTVTGHPTPFFASIKDTFGNVVSGYTGKLHLTSTDSAAKLPKDYTFLATDYGTHQFYATFGTAGSQSVSAVDSTTQTVLGTQAIPIAAGGPLGTYIVTSTADNNTCPAGSGGAGYTLRCAIADTNHAPANVQKQITFAIQSSGAASDPGCVKHVCTIVPGAPLPTIKAGYVTIDGYSQPGSKPNSSKTGNNAQIGIRIDGSSAGSNTNGLRFVGPGSTLDGISITNFSGAGIFLDSATKADNAPTGSSGEDTSISGVYAGIAPDGTSAGANGNGVKIAQTVGLVVVGGVSPAAHNLLSGNVANGLLEDGCLYCASFGFNRVQGNELGTDASGTKSVGNGHAGFAGTGSYDIVGGVEPGSSNLASGNNVLGLQVGPFSTVEGNFIGTNLSGTVAIPNGSSNSGSYEGLSLLGSDFVGGARAEARNLVSGNHGIGINATGNHNMIQGNYIGTAATGTASLPNGSNPAHGAGIETSGALNLIGGTTKGAGNVISGTTSLASGGDNGAGILSRGADLIQGNFIGTDKSGSKAIGNFGFGIHNLGGYDTIGGDTSGAGNIISGNAGGGIRIDGGYTQIKANHIGTDSAGGSPLPNGGYGMMILGPQNIIGGLDKMSPNVVAASVLDGIAVGSARNTIDGNRVGVAASGTHPLPNKGAGITFGYSGAGNVVNANTIWNNGHEGVVFTNTGPSSSVLNNSVANNGRDGIAFINSGTATIVSGNSVFHNGGNGLSFSHAGTANSVVGNALTNNGGSGVLVGANAADSGTQVVISRNAISGNGGLGIDLAPQGTVNCAGSPPGPNDFQNCPVISSATKSSMRGTACPGCTVEVYLASADRDDHGYGEGKTYLKSTQADENGNWEINGNFASPVTAGLPVTATSTSPQRTTTSEFSANYKVTSM